MDFRYGVKNAARPHQRPAKPAITHPTQPGQECCVLVKQSSPLSNSLPRACVQAPRLPEPPADTPTPNPVTPASLSAAASPPKSRFGSGPAVRLMQAPAHPRRTCLQLHSRRPSRSRPAPALVAGRPRPRCVMPTGAHARQLLPRRGTPAHRVQAMPALAELLSSAGQAPQATAQAPGTAYSYLEAPAAHPPGTQISAPHPAQWARALEAPRRRTPTSACRPRNACPPRPPQVQHHRTRPLLSYLDSARPAHRATQWLVLCAAPTGAFEATPGSTATVSGARAARLQTDVVPDPISRKPSKTLRPRRRAPTLGLKCAATQYQNVPGPRGHTLRGHTLRYRAMSPRWVGGPRGHTAARRLNHLSTASIPSPAVPLLFESAHKERYELRQRLHPRSSAMPRQ